MRTFDCIVIGNTEAALFSAAYLTRASKHVALIVNDKKTVLETSVKRFKDKRGKMYHYGGLSQPLGGLDHKGLLAFYLQKTGVDQALPVVAATPSRIVTKQGRVLTQDRGFEAFKVYLVRHFPKYRDTIETFFNAVYNHYHSYKRERQNRLLKRPYVIDSLRAEWGNLSLDAVLKQYFDNAEIRNAFTLLQGFQALPQTHLCAHAYFVYFFNHFMEPLHYIDAPISTLQTNVLKQNTSLTVIKKRIKRCDINQNRLHVLELEDGTTVKADAFYIHAHPDTFIDQCVDKDRGFHKAKIPAYFEQKPLNIKTFTYFVGLNTTADHVGIDTVETVYEHGAFQTDEATLHSTLDYSAVYTKAAPTASMALIVQATSTYALDTESLSALLAKINPNIPSHVTLVKTLSSQDTIGTYNDFLATQQSLKAKTSLEAFEHVRMFDNSFFLTDATTYETKFAGGILVAIDLADAVLAYLENEAGFVRMIEPAALINAFAYPLSSLSMHNGKRLTVSIANRSYVLVFTTGRPMIFHGFDANADALIEIDETSMHDWLFTERRVEAIQSTDSCRMSGDASLLNAIITILSEMPTSTHRNEVAPFKLPSSALMMFSVGLFIIYSVLALYGAPAIVFSVATAIQIFYVLWYRKRFDHATTWDSFALIAYPIYAGLRWVFGAEAWLNPEWVVLTAGIFWFLNSAIKNPLPHGWFVRDYPSGYAQSSYFVTLMSGLGMIIGGSIIVVFLTMRLFEGGNRFIGLLAVVIALYLAVKYPQRYERAMIKTRK